MATIQRFEDLEIWQLARLLYQKLGPIIKKLRDNHEYRFAEQLKSAGGSSMDNIAEGFERNSRLEFIYALGVSKGETGELKSQYYRLLDDTYIQQEEFDDLYELTNKLSKKISNFIKYLNTAPIKGLKFKDRINRTSEPGNDKL